MVNVYLNLVYISRSCVLSISIIFTHPFPCSFLLLVCHYFCVLGEEFPSSHIWLFPRKYLFALKPFFKDIGTFYYARKKWSSIEDRHDLVVSLPSNFRSPVWLSSSVCIFSLLLPILILGQHCISHILLELYLTFLPKSICILKPLPHLVINKTLSKDQKNIGH